jgi:predicted secreted protein
VLGRRSDFGGNLKPLTIHFPVNQRGPWPGILGGMTHIEVTDMQDLEVAVGDVVTLRLPQTAGSGFVWSVVETGAGLVTEEDTDIADPQCAPGASGAHLLRLRAARTGRWNVAVRLARSWEANALDRRSFTISVHQNQAQTERH